MGLIRHIRRVKNFVQFRSMSLKEQFTFVTRLQLLLRSGISLQAAAALLSRQSASRNARLLVRDLQDAIDRGQSVSSVLERYRAVFGDFAVNVVRVGELSGTLQENLGYLAQELQKRRLLRSKMQSALLYPAIIAVSTFGMSVLLTAFVFPKVVPIFNSLHVDLPWTTRMLMVLSEFVRMQWWGIGLSILGAMVCIALLLRLPAIRIRYDRLLFLVPALGPVLLRYHLSVATRTLSLLLKSDVPIVRVCSIVADTATNKAFEERFRYIHQQVLQGKSFAVSLESDRTLFPELLTHMVAVGEASGNLSESLRFISEMYEEELDEQARNLSTVLEPVLLLCMGLLVGFIALSIITPIYQVTQHLRPK